MKRFPYQSHSLLWRILLSTAIAVTVAFALTGWIVQRRTAAISQAGQEREIRMSLQAYESLWNAEVQSMTKLSRIMSSMSDVRAAFMTHDRATIQDAAGQLWSKISEQYATFLVLDPTGNLIASLGGKPEFTVSPTLVRTALKRFPKQVAGYAVQGARLYYVVLTPVYVQAQHEEGLLNILLIAFDIDAGLTEDLKSCTNGSDFVFTTPDRIVASTLPGIDAADILSGPDLPGGARRISVRGRDYLLVGTGLEDTTGHSIGHLYVIRSLAALKAAVRDLRRAVGLFWIAGLIVACVLSYALFRRVLKPVRTLDRAAAEIIKRNYDYRAPVETGDELGRLAISFNQMCDSIRAAREDLIRQEQIATVGRLSTSIVHDLRNPLAAIYGGAEMLVDAELTEEQRRRLAATIYSSSRRIQALLQDLLDASRGECKTQENCHLLDIVLAAREQLQQSAELHAVGIHVAIAPELEVLAARDRLERVFVNLIQNAIDAMPGGGSVRIEGREEAGQAIVLVEDNGPGISEEAWQNLFRPFASFGKKNGLGLGLALSRQVLLDHGGDLWVERRSGAGACFSIRLTRAGSSEKVSRAADNDVHAAKA